MKKTIFALAILITSLLNAQKIDVQDTRKLYLKSNDSIVGSYSINDPNALEKLINHFYKYPDADSEIITEGSIKVKWIEKPNNSMVTDTIYITNPPIIDTVYVQLPPIIIKDTVYIEKPIEEPKDTIATPPIQTGNAYKFKKTEWGIVEGKVSDDIALSNRNKLQTAIDQAKVSGFTVFEIDDLDAYFHFNYGWYDAKRYDDMAIHLPSNFHLKMTDNTHLRLQPNNWPKGAFISIYEKENVKISGGNIYGDRFTHDYSDILDEVGISRGTHEWPALIIVAGSSNVLIDSIYLTDSTGDAFIFGATNGFVYRNPDKKQNKNVILKNSTVNKSRRNNISVTDGNYLTIDNCKILNAGDGENIYDNDGKKIVSSAGIAPRVGIDIEPFIGYETNGDEILFEQVTYTTIKNCEFTGNVVASILEYTGKNTVIENNTSDNGFNAAYGSNTSFLNNTLIASSINAVNKTGITTPSRIVNGKEFSSKSVVIGNTIKDFNVSMSVSGNDIKVKDNVCTNFWLGVKIKNATDVIFENIDLSSSKFVYSQSLEISNSNNISFNSLKVDLPRRPISIVSSTVDNLKFTNSSFKSAQAYSILIDGVPNVSFQNTVLENTSFDVKNYVNFFNN